MTIFRTEHKRNYTVVNNFICKDKRISWKAKGIWLYAFSRPDDWEFNLHDLINQSADGRESVQSGLKELENAGYLHRCQKRDKGQFSKAEWVFYETPQEIKISITETGNPTAANPSSANPFTENPPLLSTDSLSPEATPIMEQQQQPCVVVSPNSESFELLKTQGFDDKTATYLAKFPKNRILRQIRHLADAMDEVNITNPIGWLRNAIESNWNPPEKNVDPAVAAAELRSKQLVERTAIKRQCEALFDEYENRFTAKKYFILGGDVLTMRSGDDNFGTPYDSEAVNLLKTFIRTELL